ncbi:ubiquitin specific protease, putative [Plasmodium berghei]|uniref:ubiquitinyl hydrolase 1 n=2 Tax=Plasmodium berghei TaxID=5821 RepID=A0A509AMD5_PLABA|nr:ubiquitin specific protease, putative [Plasmodium berghei ANKA]CXI48634.1 ubiquitin specific protease, putative [Plasmodium berghei]SCL93830.1 ubiquitin specific protease, putative [Plasmodium berghei]SCM15886.1 ubiquitin specific protease, putative [Plasmodium berghei]SCM17682.1 ubiquitin specific protease, putative [Plasmodium berghei]SCN25831.1 ubiquitin specific protease, putative [Plasmodium berghei]|eukprot:XP_034421811.1 ubiquitin specific protease, putative [Plasmodium berghei ANKA]
MNISYHNFIDLFNIKNYEYYEKYYNYEEAKRSHTAFINNGNICYCNASLQLILSIKPLCIYILKNFDKFYLKTQSKYKGDIIKTMYELIHETYNIGETKNNNVLCTNKQINLLKKINKYNLHLDIFSQNDAHEFMLLLLNYINIECNRYTDNEKNMEIILDENDGKELAGDKYWVKYLYKENSIITDLLGFQNISTITCFNCDHTRYSFEFCLDLGLEFPDENIKSTTLIELLRNNINKSDDICSLDCNNCKLKKTSRIKKGIYRMPNLYMIIYIKRFKWVYYQSNNCYNNKVKKIDTIVLLPQDGIVDFTNFLQLSNHNSLYNAKYIIESIICHSGNSYNGHYTSIVKHYDGFYKCNDDKIYKLDTPYDPNNISDIYLLLLRRLS